MCQQCWGTRPTQRRCARPTGCLRGGPPARATRPKNTKPGRAAPGTIFLYLGPTRITCMKSVIKEIQAPVPARPGGPAGGRPGLTGAGPAPPLLKALHASSLGTDPARPGDPVGGRPGIDGAGPAPGLAQPEAAGSPPRPPAALCTADWGGIGCAEPGGGETDRPPPPLLRKEGPSIHRLPDLPPSSFRQAAGRRRTAPPPRPPVSLA